MEYNLENCWQYKNEIIKLIEERLDRWEWTINKLKQMDNEHNFQSILLSIFTLLVWEKIIDNYIPEGFEMSNEIKYRNIFMNKSNIPNNFKFPNECWFIYLKNSNIGNNVILPNKCNNIELYNSIIGHDVILPKKCDYIYIDNNTKFGNNITYPEKCMGIKIDN